MIKKLVKNRKGFTLTELIVVVAILGVLAAVVTPSIMGYLSDAKVSADKANATTIDNTVKRMMAKGTLSLDTATYASINTAASKTAIKTIIQKELTPYPTISGTGYHFVLQRTVDGSGKCTAVSVQLLSATTTPPAPVEGNDVAYIE
jgi:prepilin-type N-terminal cleavage/methylation domain-containing protein